ncbi:hypothetical protein BXZ70DRAFT_1011580 [Cristinia sonorae]|uniref:Uncharacterized protein n=1 Tax=Cristinia sonorae TaxID=1940300 RepID=A0A8K0UG98_9AGAR|nr:hypothetical protein BXZ70DRAFT_1011580 [Cristinia sonorae]
MGRAQEFNRPRRLSPTPATARSAVASTSSTTNPPTTMRRQVSRASPTPQPPQQPVITYCLGPESKMYTARADAYEDAIRLAQRSFPRQLGHLQPEQIQLSITSTSGSMIGIAPSAWATLSSRFKPCQVVHITTTYEIPPILVLDEEGRSAPPKYAEADAPPVEKPSKPQSVPTSPASPPSRLRSDSDPSSPSHTSPPSPSGFMTRVFGGRN